MSQHQVNEIVSNTKKSFEKKSVWQRLRAYFKEMFAPAERRPVIDGFGLHLQAAEGPFVGGKYLGLHILERFY